MKLTKRIYEKKRTELVNLLNDTHKDLLDFTNKFNGYSETCSGECGNMLSDFAYIIEQAIKDLDYDYDTRNWTHADHASMSLILDNID